MKRFLLTLAVLMVSITAAFAAVYSGSCGTNVTYTLDTETGVLKIEGTGRMNDYSSSLLNGVYVTTAPWRDYYRTLKSVTISQGVTSIGGYAFYDCSSLTSITIPESVTSIGDYAFSHCSPLTSITIPESVTSIGRGIFYGCSSLTSITIPSSVTSIDGSAFSHCSSLTSITIPSSVTSIDGSAFSGCSSLTSITIPESVTSIGNYAFYNCSSLTSITIPESVTSIGNYAFRDCSSLTSITIPESVTSIGERAFDGCSSLTSVTIPEGVTSIGYYAFNGCSSLTSVTIPEGVTYIGKYAFQGCSSLTSITIPSSVTSIGSSPFSGCTDLISIKVDPNNTVYDSRDNCNAIIKTATNTLIAGCKSTTIPEGVKSIGYYAFDGCSSLASITIPEGVTSIGEGAFRDCSSLTSITIPESVTSIRDWAFSGCSSLASITIPEGVTSIRDYAFRYCSSLTSITIPSSVTSIGYSSAFSGCPDLISIKVDPNNTVYDSRDNCNAIIETATNTLIAGCKSTIIPSSVTSIRYNAFRGCSSLTSISIPEGVKSIGDYAFDGCSSLTSITIPQGVTSIGLYAFWGCSSLTSITIPEGVTSIESSTFASCPGLISINVDPNNTVYDSRDNCNAIIKTATNTLIAGCKSTTIPQGVTSIGLYAFWGCSSLTSITIPEGVTSIGDYAFCGCSSLTDVVCLSATPPTCGNSFSTYDTLHVLPGFGDAYRAAETWNQFTIVEDAVDPNATYSLAFVVDDEQYHACTLKMGEEIILPEAPTKEGYTFQRWEGLPEDMLMPGNDFTVTAIFEKNATETPDEDFEATDIAAMDDAVYIEAAEGSIGSQLVLPILMKNSFEVTGFQFDIYLPEGITVAEDEDGFPMVELSTKRTTTTKTNLFDYSYQPDGSLRILCSSTKGYSFTGNDGEVAMVTINISEDIEAGDYPIVLKNIVITDAQGADKKKVDLVKSTLTLFDHILGDVNGDNEIDVADLSAISSYILGHPSESFVEMAADVNKDNEIDVADISALAYLILHPETAQKAKARKVAAKKELTENTDNTLYAEMLQAEGGTDVVLPIMMRNSIEATGFQLDLMLPEGITLKDAALSNARTTSKRTNLFDYAHQADGTYRILCNSTKGLSFNGHDGEVMILTLHIDKDAELGAQTIALKDMVLTDATGMLREESSISESTLWIGNATGIHEMASEKSATTYDLQGRQVSKKQKGIVISDGKKIMKK